MPCWFPLRIASSIALVAMLLVAAKVNAAEPRKSEIVLFPFDDCSIPFNKGLVLTLIPGKKSNVNSSLGIDPKHPSKPVLAIGKEGDPDFPRAYFCGTVLFVDGEYRMWYSGFSNDARRQVCYAVSNDGIQWKKPKLGLAEYRGNKQNNLVGLDDGQPVPGMIVLVLHDADDPDPARRFKMIREVNPAKILAAVSADGVNWRSLNNNEDVIGGKSNLEPTGFIRHNGVYYLCGHGGPIPHPIQARGFMRPQKRMMVTHVSYDFEHWTEAAHLSYRRDSLPPRGVLDFEFHSGEQMHLGASLWNRGNVILGFYGQWHNPTNDRRTAVVDIGLVVSHDALHFKEPLPDFKIIPSFEEEDRAEPRLTQGQAFHNIGDRTFVYYGIWTEVDRNSPTGVRIATWSRDRLGYFAPVPDIADPHCISSPLKTPGADARVYLNATGFSSDGSLTVELLDEQFRPLPGFTAADMEPLAANSGLKLPLTWKNRPTLNDLNEPFRLRVNWEGPHPEKTRLYAVYVE